MEQPSAALLTEVPSSSPRREFCVRILPENWTSSVQTAAMRLVELRTHDYVSPEFFEQESVLRTWLQDALGHLPMNSRIFIIQDPGLRLLDLATLIPFSFDPPRINLAITPVFTNGLSFRQIERLRARTTLRPERTEILVARVHGVSNQEDVSLEVACARARRAGVQVKHTEDPDVIREFLTKSLGPSRTHILFGHCPRRGSISVGQRVVSIADVLNNSQGHAGHSPSELDLSICYGELVLDLLVDTHGLASRQRLWTEALANIQCELWTSTWRRALGGQAYGHELFSYGEALIQARAMQRYQGEQGRDLVSEFLLTEQSRDCQYN